MAPLTSRKTDMAYFGFFAMFATSMIFMDLIPLWPKAILPTILANNHAWYVATFNDQLMIKFEPWFASFLALEALYQLPMTLWFLFALPKDDREFTVHLLVYGVVGLLTTTTSCVAIYMDKDMSQMEKNVLLGFYSPFAVVFGYMMMDMFCRIQSKIVPFTKISKKRAQRKYI